MKIKLMSWKQTLFFILVATSIVACSSSKNQPAALEPEAHLPTVANNELVFVTQVSPNIDTQKNDQEWSGIEYELASLFVKQYAPELKLRFVAVKQTSEIIPILLKNQAHIAAANFAITPMRKALVQFSSPYDESQEQLVYRADTDAINTQKFNISQLSTLFNNKTIRLPESASAHEYFEKIRKSQPTLKWQTSATDNAELLLKQVANNELDFTVANQRLVSQMAYFYPNLAVAMPIGEPEKIAWALSKNADPNLVTQVNHFFKKIRKDGTLANLLDRYYGHINRLNTQDVSTFIERSDTLLPQYAPLFKAAQVETGLDWRLLAALSYRESHWDTLNTSPTGVRGMMMLTENTADLMGVTDRLDPKQSIPAGAHYIVKMIELIPENVPEPDRTYMALAAYNIGYAHVQDARVLTKRLNLNPDNWLDVKKTLLKLSDPTYYSMTKFGYADGSAPVIFVESVRSYQQILEHFEAEYTTQHHATVAQNN
jgi:membrane-bound lytic murein transglycosylase F